jgi:hypothetical protein
MCGDTECPSCGTAQGTRGAESIDLAEFFAACDRTDYEIMRALEGIKSDLGLGPVIHSVRAYIGL